MLHWWYWNLQFPFMILKDFVSPLKNNPLVTSLLMLVVISFSCLAIALSSLFLGQNLLDKTPQITNPIKHIAKVLNYARKKQVP